MKRKVREKVIFLFTYANGPLVVPRVGVGDAPQVHVRHVLRVVHEHLEHAVPLFPLELGHILRHAVLVGVNQSNLLRSVVL